MKNLSVACFQYHEALNAGFLNELFADDPAYAVTVFEGFNEEAPICWCEIETAFEKDDVPGFKCAVHKYRSLFNYVGFTEITGLLQAMENSCATVSSTQNLQPEMARLRAQRQRGEAIIKEETQRLQAFYEG